MKTRDLTVQYRLLQMFSLAAVFVWVCSNMRNQTEARRPLLKRFFIRVLEGLILILIVNTWTTLRERFLFFVCWSFPREGNLDFPLKRLQLCQMSNTNAFTHSGLLTNTWLRSACWLTEEPLTNSGRNMYPPLIPSCCPSHFYTETPQLNLKGKEEKGRGVLRLILLTLR